MISALPALANSARTVDPQLVGVKVVFLNISLQNLPDVDDQALEKEIRAQLAKAGISVDPSAPISLFVSLTYRQLPACPEFVAFQTEIALSEEVPVRRGVRTESVYVNTWQTSNEFVESKTKAGQVAYDSLVRSVRYFIDSAQYSESVIKNRK